MEMSHKSADCPCVPTLDGRKKILTEKKLCFNCTGPRQPEVECVIKMSCKLCSRRHHTSICNDQHLKREDVMSSLGDDKVVYPVVVVKVGRIECCALLDSGASSSYASAKLLDLFRKQPTEIKPNKTEILRLLLQQEWRSSRPLFHQGLGTTAWMSVLLKSIGGSVLA